MDVILRDPEWSKYDKDKFTVKGFLARTQRNPSEYIGLEKDSLDNLQDLLGLIEDLDEDESSKKELRKVMITKWNELNDAVQYQRAFDLQQWRLKVLTNDIDEATVIRVGKNPIALAWKRSEIEPKFEDTKIQTDEKNRGIHAIMEAYLPIMFGIPSKYADRFTLSWESTLNGEGSVVLKRLDVGSEILKNVKLTMTFNDIVKYNNALYSETNDEIPYIITTYIDGTSKSVVKGKTNGKKGEQWKYFQTDKLNFVTHLPKFIDNCFLRVHPQNSWMAFTKGVTDKFDKMGLSAYFVTAKTQQKNWSLAFDVTQKWTQSLAVAFADLHLHHTDNSLVNEKTQETLLCFLMVLVNEWIKSVATYGNLPDDVFATVDITPPLSLTDTMDEVAVLDWFENCMYELIKTAFTREASETDYATQTLPIIYSDYYTEKDREYIVKTDDKKSKVLSKPKPKPIPTVKEVEDLHKLGEKSAYINTNKSTDLEIVKIAKSVVKARKGMSMISRAAANRLMDTESYTETTWIHETNIAMRVLTNARVYWLSIFGGCWGNFQRIHPTMYTDGKNAYGVAKKSLKDRKIISEWASSQQYVEKIEFKSVLSMNHHINIVQIKSRDGVITKNINTHPMVMEFNTFITMKWFCDKNQHGDLFVPGKYRPWMDYISKQVNTDPKFLEHLKWNHNDAPMPTFTI